MSNSSRIDKSIDGNVKLLSKTTLMLRLMSGNESRKKSQSTDYVQRLQFDAVGYEEERHVKDELNGLLAQMIRHHRSGCLLRLTPRRSHNVNLLTHLLVSQLDKLLGQHRLEGICVEYYDVRKFDMINMLAKSRRSGKREMQSTSELFQWLRNEYASLRVSATGDDYIHVEFLLNDGGHRHKVQFSLFDIFDCTCRTDLVKFFRQLPKRKHSQNSLILDCIKESFDSKRSVCTLVLCEISLDKECVKELPQFLQLADLASRSIGGKEIQSKSTDSHSLEDIISSESKDLSIQSPYARPASLTHEDYSKLSSWYFRIDSIYSKVRSTMERHYNMQYRQKFLKLCQQLKYSRISNDKSGGDAHRLLLQRSFEDVEATANYAEALRQFRQLEKEVNKSNFAPTLSTYLSTKNFELLNDEYGLQQRELLNLREHRSLI
ncbi:GH17027 [Drosophila grimshawi]|uniref:GH17027 n=2 Tax=Drosophila grimshawi TaxID=7222 RepID=B4JU68_DROGR|nr:GH17027 [Drosophila grimshawi]